MSLVGGVEALAARVAAEIKTLRGEMAPPSYANLPAGTTITVMKAGGTWPARPTSRADIVVCWKGANPAPPIVGSGTGGMLDNVDWQLVV